MLHMPVYLLPNQSLIVDAGRKGIGVNIIIIRGLLIMEGLLIANNFGGYVQTRRSLNGSLNLRYTLGRTCHPTRQRINDSVRLRRKTPPAHGTVQGIIDTALTVRAG